MSWDDAHLFLKRRALRVQGMRNVCPDDARTVHAMPEQNQSGNHAHSLKSARAEIVIRAHAGRVPAVYR